MANPLTLLQRALLRGPLVTKTGTWAGRTTLNSGSASVTVSTTSVKSDSIILVTAEVTNTGVNSGHQIVVSSIVDSTSFALATAQGNGVGWNQTIMWAIINTK